MSKTLPILHDLLVIKVLEKKGNLSMYILKVLFK